MGFMLAAMSAVAFTSGAMQGYESPDVVISNMRQASQLATQWSNMWLAEPNANCASNTVRRAESISDEITRIAVSSAATLDDYTKGETSKWWARRVLDGVAPIAAQTRLDLGNSYLRGGCLDDADRVFRDVMTTFTGPQYQSLARVGIDEVREARRAATTRSDAATAPAPAPDTQ